MNSEPISTTSYHDWLIDGLILGSDFVEFRLSLEGKSATIRLLNVKFALASDVLLCNIVNHIFNAVISLENRQFILQDLIEFYSQYFSKDEYDYYSRLDDIIGLNYVSITSTYGMRAGIICARIEEIHQANS